MELALGWIGEIFRALLLFVPRLLIVKATHGGVKFVRGRKIVPIQPGLHIYWPLVTECVSVPVMRQTTNLAPQVLITADSQVIGVSGILVYEVEDASKLLTACWDYDETIRDHCLAAIKQVVTANALNFLIHNTHDTDHMLTRQLRRMLKRFGVRVIRVTLSDIAPCWVITGLAGTEQQAVASAAAGA